MQAIPAVDFFDRQFRRQVDSGDYALNPFERAVLPFLSGEVLDLGCGLGNLALAAAAQGCRVTALDASQVAIADLQRRAREHKLSITARLLDLKNLNVEGRFDSVVAIGLLMFFPRAEAQSALPRIKDLVIPGGVTVLNVLIEGTTYLDMFDPDGYYLFRENELGDFFGGWSQDYLKIESFSAPHGTCKRFCTLVARKPRPSHSPYSP